MVPVHPLCERTKAGVGRVWHFSSAKLSGVEQVFDSGSGAINHSPKDFSRMFIVDGPALTRSVMTVACYRPLRANASATAEDVKPFCGSPETSTGRRWKRGDLTTSFGAGQRYLILQFITSKSRI